MDKEIYENISIPDEQIEDSTLSEVTEASIESRMRLIDSFSLTLTNLQQFQDTVRADMDSIANRIMVDEEQIRNFQSKIDAIVNDKRVKSQNWEGHIFYTLFQKQKEVTDMFLKVSVLKSLYIQYLINVNNKISQAMKALRREFIEMERLKAETNMLEKFFELIKKEKEQWMENYNKTIETRFESFNKAFADLQTTVEKNDEILKTMMRHLDEKIGYAVSKKVQEEILKNFKIILTTKALPQTTQPQPQPAQQPQLQPILQPQASQTQTPATTSTPPPAPPAPKNKISEIIDNAIKSTPSNKKVIFWKEINKLNLYDDEKEILLKLYDANMFKFKFKDYQKLVGKSTKEAKKDLITYVELKAMVYDDNEKVYKIHPNIMAKLKEA